MNGSPVSLPQNAIFNTPTIGELLKLVDTESTEAVPEEPSAPIFALESKTEHIPLSYSQRRLWFLHKLAPESPAFNLVISSDITGELKPDLFEQAILAVIDRHDVLRSTFADRDGIPQIIVRDDLTISVEHNRPRPSAPC